MGYFRPQPKEMRKNKQKKIEEQKLKKLLTPEQFELAREDFIEAEVKARLKKTWNKLLPVLIATLRVHRISEDRAKAITTDVLASIISYAGNMDKLEE